MPKKPLIIPIFLPHSGCPQRCIFCDQSTITGQSQTHITVADFQERVDTFLSYRQTHHTDVQIAFYGGNFLGTIPKRFLTLLEYAQTYILQGKVDGIRFSTRPESIQPDTLDAVRRFSITTVELGVQSMDDEVLRLSNRGHTSEDTFRAVEGLKETPYRIGLQMMVGLPGDPGEPSIASARELIRLKPDFVRIYPTIVLDGSPLADWLRNGEYRPMPLEACVTLVKQIYLMFKQAGIPVVRMGLQTSQTLSSDAIIAGPFHPAFGHLVHSEIFLDSAIAALKGTPGIPRHACIRVHPRSVARMHGEKNYNVKMLRKIFALETLIIQPDDSLPEDHVAVGSRG